ARESGGSSANDAAPARRKVLPALQTIRSTTRTPTISGASCPASPTSSPAIVPHEPIAPYTASTGGSSPACSCSLSSQPAETKPSVPATDEPPPAIQAV